VPLFDKTLTTSVDAVKWNGGCANEVAQGRGTFEVTERIKFHSGTSVTTTWKGEGEFVDGKLNGRAFIVSGDGSRREGVYRDGVLNGRGFETTVRPPRRFRFDGEYREGQRTGWGTYEVYDSEQLIYRAEGDWQNGELNGRAIEVRGLAGCKLQMRYEGEMKDGRFHGRGTLTRYDGEKFVGVWDQGKINGAEPWTLWFFQAYCKG
jgi:hypothetical protein